MYTNRRQFFRYLSVGLFRTCPLSDGTNLYFDQCIFVSTATAGWWSRDVMPKVEAGIFEMLRRFQKGEAFLSKPWPRWDSASLAFVPTYSSPILYSNDFFSQFLFWWITLIDVSRWNHTIWNYLWARRIFYVEWMIILWSKRY